MMTTEQVMIERIAAVLVGINYQDLTPAEHHIYKILSEAGYLELDQYDTVTKAED